MKLKTGNGVAPSRFDYTSQIPGYSANDNPLGDVGYQDPIMSSGQINGICQTIGAPYAPFDSGGRKLLLYHYEGRTISRGDAEAILSSCFGEGYNEIQDALDEIDRKLENLPVEGDDDFVGPVFEPHPMYNPETGDMVMANTFEDHLYYQSLGYVHEPPSMNGNGGTSEVKDFRLIGGIAIVILGGLIVRSYRK